MFEALSKLDTILCDELGIDSLSGWNVFLPLRMMSTSVGIKFGKICCEGMEKDMSQPEACYAEVA